MISKLTAPFIVVALAILFVLIDHNLAHALPLDPSEIKIAEIIQQIPMPAKVAGGAAIVLIVRTWIFADGHTERADDNKKDK